MNDIQGHWAETCIEILSQQGKAVIALTAGLGFTPSRSTSATLAQSFSDAATIPVYAKDTVAAAVEQQLMVNYPDIKRFRPNKPATSPSPAGYAYDSYLQDWPAWVRSGYVEELLVQIYRRNLSSFEYELTVPAMVSARDRIPTGIGVLSGLRQDFMDSELVAGQVLAARQQGYAGVAFFFYESIWQAGRESVAAREAMVRSLFPTPKARPTLNSELPDAAS